MASARFITCGLFFVLVHLVLLRHADAQVHRTFRGPPVQVFDTDVHPGDEAFYAVAQDANGSIIAGNSWGPVTFSGLRWELVPMPPPAYQPVYALAAGGDRVYFTAQKDFGYLDEDAAGRTRYVSLRERTGNQTGPEFHPSGVQVAADRTWFIARNGVLSWSDTDVEFHAMVEPAMGGVLANNRLFLLREDGGLCGWEASSCTTLLPPGTFESPIRFLLDMADARLLVGLDSGELFTWIPGQTPRHFKNDATPYLAAHGPYSGRVLRDGSIFIWTFRKGGVWLAADGSVLGTLDNEHTDIPNSTINHAFEDRDGDLWLATNTALVHVSLRAPVAVMPRFGPDDLFTRGGAVIGDRLLLGTNAGLWTSGAPDPDDTRGSLPSFTPLGAGIGRTFRMGTVARTPFVFSEGHLMAVEDGRAYETGVTGGRDIISDFRDRTRVTTGTGSGVAMVARNPVSDRWQPERLHDLGHNVMDVAWSPDGVLWATVEPGGVLRIEFDPETGNTARVDHFAQVVDYPMDISQVESVWGTVVFVSDAGLVTPDLEHPDRFVPIEIPGAPMLDPPGISGNLFADGRRTLVAQFPDGILLAENRTWRPGLLAYSRDALPLVLDDTGPTRHLWSWRAGRLLRHDVDAVDAYPRDWTVRIRGMWAGDSIAVDPSPSHPARVARGIESMHVELAAPRFRDLDRLRVRHRLIGLTDTWSEPGDGWRLDFNVLKPGTYTLEVQGIDAQGMASAVQTASFVIRPPWYRSDIALGSWLLLLLGLMGGATYGWQHNRVLALERRERELEEQVVARTQEIASQKAEIERQATRLKELDASKSRFFANVSHEFRTPLTLITAPVLDALDGEYGPLPDRAIQAFERAQLNSDRLLRLVNQLLDLARLESGQLKTVLERADMGAFCRRIVSMFEHVADSRGIRLASGIPDDAVFVCMDIEQMEKVMANLLSNAIKFSSDGGRISVALRAETGGCVVSVSDTGIGIPEEALPRIFERFFQVDDGTTRAHDGMGIGLAMSREIIRLHGGEMTVSSTPGEGSTFTFRIPNGECAEQAVHPVAIPTGESHTEAPHLDEDSADDEDLPVVLIVEDNPDMRAYVAGLFKDSYRVVEAENGARATVLAVEYVPDIIVSDLMMPDVDGIDFCRAVRADMRTSHIPFIMLTAKADEESRMEGLETGADVYLEKPFRPRELRAQLGNLVRSRTRLQAHLRGESVPPEAPAPVLSAADRAFMDRVAGVSESRIFDSTFSVDVFADEVHMSRRQLLRKMKALLGESPRAYVQRMRLERARALLAEGQMVEDVSISVGYADRSSFSRAFTEYFGTPPSRV